MATILANGLVQFVDGRILYSDTPLTGQDFMELQELLPRINPIIGRSAMVGFPFVSGGGGGGSPGARGVDGTPGATGPQGVTGPGAGAQGVTGVQGPQGQTGAGIQGPTGPQGPQGQTGVQGTQGTTGVGTQGGTGVQGQTGVQGSQGQTGTQGQTGPAGTITNDIFASDRVVDPAGAGTDTTLAAALAALPASGGTIYLKAGTYAISATMTLPLKDVTIIGAGANLTIGGTPNGTIFDLGANAIFLFDTAAGGGGTVFASYKFKGFQVIGTSLAGQGFLNMPVGALGSSVVAEQLNIDAVQDIVKTNGQDSDVTFRDCVLRPLTANASFWHGAGAGGELNWDHVQATIVSGGSPNAITGGPSWNVAYSYIGGPPGNSTYNVKDINWVAFFFGKLNDKATVTVTSAISTIVSCQFIGITLIINTTLLFASNSWFSGSSTGANAQVTLNGVGGTGDMTITGVNFDASGAIALVGLDIVGITNVEISGCQFEGHSNSGIRASGTSTLSATGCRFTETVPIRETAATVSGKYASNNGITGSILIGTTSTVDGRIVRTVTGNTTLDDTYETVLVDATGGAVTITLPLSAAIPYKRYNIKKIDATANTVTVDGNGAETIDGSLTQVISTQYESLTPESDNLTSWWIV